MTEPRESRDFQPRAGRNRGLGMSGYSDLRWRELQEGSASLASQGKACNRGAQCLALARPV